MVMFVISGIATHTERLFADSRASNTCSFCGHNIENSENGHFSKQNSKKRCKFCGHGLGSGEYNREEDGYKAQFSRHNYDDEETKSKSGKKHSGTKKKKNKGKYALDLRGVHFYDEDIESFESEEENDDSAVLGNQRHHVKSLDDWDEDDDSSYDDEDEGEESEYDEFDEEEEPEEEDQSEEADPDNDNGESATPTTVFPSQMTNIGTPQLPIMQQLPTGILPTAPTEETTAFPTLQPNEMQNPALLQSMQYPASEQQNQTATMDSNALAAQYPYNQQNIGNPNINLQQNQMLQDNQNGMNDMNNNAYGQMNGASMMSQYGNAGINQQDYASVVNETIGYLQEMGLLDENRVSKMSAGMVEGKCIICMKQKFVFQIRGQGTLGVCEDCLRSRDSYGGAFSAGGIKGVLEKGVMSLLGGGNDDNRGGGGNNGIRSYSSGGGYDDSGGGYYRNPYSNGEMMGNGTPSPVGADQLRSIANKLTGTVGGGLRGIFSGGNNIFGNGTSGSAGAGSQQMVLNAQGQLVPMGSDPSAPYGYIKDPSTGQMRPATSAAEGLAAGAAATAAGATTAPGVANGSIAGTTATGTIAGGGAGASGQQMVMNAQGQLVPMGSDPSAPYGYVKDPSTGQMRPATSPAEGLAAGAAAAAAGAPTAPGATNGVTGAVAKTTEAATSAVSTAANAATGAVENATNTAVGVANTAVNAANNAAATAANTASQVANSAEAIKNAAQPLTSLASSVGSLVSSVASGIKSKSASTNENSSTYSDNDDSRQSTSKQNDTSNSNNQTRKKKKKKKGSTASADGSSGTNSGTQQQSSKKKKKQKDSTASAKDTSGTQQSTKKKKKSSKAT